MKYFYKNDDYYAGFCAKLNNAINVCSVYNDIFNDFDLNIQISELSNIFNLFKSEEYMEDFEHIWKNSNFDNSCNAHTLCDKDKIMRKNYIYRNFFKLKNIENYETQSRILISDKTLGLHIRGTDKHQEVREPSKDIIISRIRHMLDKHDIENIYLATDDKKYKDMIFQEFGDIVIWKDKTISENGMPIHFIPDRTEINKEVMMDVYLLSKCKYFIYCFSNVSHAALTLGINDFIDIDCIN